MGKKWADMTLEERKKKSAKSVARQKERMASDPEYAAKVKKQNSEWIKKNWHQNSEYREKRTIQKKLRLEKTEARQLEQKSWRKHKQLTRLNAQFEAAMKAMESGE